jgi:hypothetical protein
MERSLLSRSEEGDECTNAKKKQVHQTKGTKEPKEAWLIK